MKRIGTSDLVPGMVTAEDVYNYNNQLIIPKGLVLDDKTIAKLDYYSILSIRIEDKKVEVNNDAQVYAKSYSEKIKESPEFVRFKAEFDEDVDNFKAVINDVVLKGSPLDVDQLMNHTLNILDIGATTPNLLDMLHCMREYDDATYTHCMNVALICNVMARWLKMDEESIKTATTAGLLHDIGKTQIPDSIIKKPAKLTPEEYTIIKRHPQAGYELLKKSSLDPEILNAVLMHHERFDGTGYPLGLKGNQLPTFARMVSIADVYDAMTSARVYRGPLCPFKTIEVFEDEGLQKYDPHFIMSFLENVVNTYLLNSVQLSNGDKGTIVYINKDKLSSPTIRTENDFIDLSKHSEIKIEAII
ncbi:MAG: HD-GYP domain-containing protein [Lachnospiraceae bacterium]|nr:HD-GYP domain-containing protein [Lachnospiraceae bacterium]